MVSQRIRRQKPGAKDAPACAAPPDGRCPPAEEGSDTMYGEPARPMIRLRVDDGLLMAFGPNGDPVPPGRLTATDRDVSGYDSLRHKGATVDPERMISVLLAQRTGGLAAPGRWSDRWIEAMLGTAGHFEPTPADLLAAEAETTCRIDGDGLQLAMPAGERLVIRDAHPGSACPTNLGKLVFDGKSLSVGQLRTLLDPIQEVSDGHGNRLIARSTGCSLACRGDAVFLDLGDRGRARLLAAEPVWCGAPLLELGLADGRGVSVERLLLRLRLGGQPRDRAAGKAR